MPRNDAVTSSVTQGMDTKTPIKMPPKPLRPTEYGATGVNIPALIIAASVTIGMVVGVLVAI